MYYFQKNFGNVSKNACSDKLECSKTANGFNNVLKTHKSAKCSVIIFGNISFCRTLYKVDRVPMVTHVLSRVAWHPPNL